MASRQPFGRVLVFTVFFASAVCNAAVRYAIQEVPSLGSDGWGFGINDAGDVTGLSYLSDTSLTYHAFLYSHGTLFDLTPGLSGDSKGWAINNDAQIAATARGAVLFSNGTMTSLPVSGTPLAINSAGQIVGVGNNAFLYSNGQIIPLGTLGGTSSTATGINDSGQITGYSQISSGATHAFIDSNGVMTDLGLPAGFSISEGTAINASGQVAGYADDKAFLYSNSQWINLGVLPEFLSSRSLAINDAGQVVGNAYSGDAGFGGHAFIYTDGVMSDLNTLIDPALGWDLVSATGINSSGQITGYGSNAAGQGRAFILTPVPEPVTLPLMAAASVLLYRKRG